MWSSHRSAVARDCMDTEDAMKVRLMGRRRLGKIRLTLLIMMALKEIDDDALCQEVGSP